MGPPWNSFPGTAYFSKNHAALILALSSGIQTFPDGLEGGTINKVNISNIDFIVVSFYPVTASISQHPHGNMSSFSSF